MPDTHKFHSFSLKGRTGRINFLGSQYDGPQGTTIVLDYDDLIALVEAIADAALLHVAEQPVVRPRHLTVVKDPTTTVTGSGDYRAGAWTLNPEYHGNHPAHHPHKQEGA